MKKTVLSLVSAILCISAMQGKVVLPHILGDNMVLQQNTEATLWGKARPSSKITVTASWSNTPVFARSDRDGRWEAKVTTPAAGFTSHTITVSDGTGEDAVIKDILSGEVWLCSGQSNMEMPFDGYWNCPVEGAAEAIASAGMYTGIRFATIPKKGSYEPEDDVDTRWLKSTPGNVQWFSAVAFHFAKMLNMVLDVPVGIISCAWGGSKAEGWMPENAVKGYNDPWLDEQFGKNDIYNWQSPVIMYNGMLHPMRKYTIKGFLWYQGESNVGREMSYRERLPEMVGIWREMWGNDALPFYLAELAPYIYGGDGTAGARFREVQHTISKTLEHSGMVCTNDLVYPYEEDQIHPCRKEEIGNRFAYLALNRTYGIDGIRCDGPEYKSMAIDGDTVEVFFDNAESGLSPWHGITGFELAGSDRVFHPAEATVNTDHKSVIVHSDAVAEPVAVRYCFRDFQIGNLTGRRNAPAVPFRSDNW